MCDETADCDDGTDELSAFCTKQYVVVSNSALLPHTVLKCHYEWNYFATLRYNYVDSLIVLLH